MADLAAIRKPVDTVIGQIDRLVRFAIMLAIGGMVIIVATQVFARYALNSSIGWADEVSRLLFIWSIFLAIPIGLRLGSHIGVTLVTDRLPAAARHRLERLTMGVGAMLMLLVAYEALVITVAQWDELMVSIDVSAGYFLLALAVGGFHSFLHLLRMTIFGPYDSDGGSS